MRSERLRGIDAKQVSALWVSLALAVFSPLDCLCGHCVADVWNFSLHCHACPYMSLRFDGVCIQVVTGPCLDLHSPWPLIPLFVLRCWDLVVDGWIFILHHYSAPPWLPGFCCFALPRMALREGRGYKPPSCGTYEPPSCGSYKPSSCGLYKPPCVMSCL